MTTHPKVEFQAYSPIACIVTLRGEQDLSGADVVAAALDIASAYAYVLVDLTYCTFADSSLLNMLVRAAKHAQGSGGALELVVAAGRDAVRRTIEVAKIDTLVTLHATRGEGIAAIASKTHSLSAKVEDATLADVTEQTPEQG